jgi:hypothetical protein
MVSSNEVDFNLRGKEGVSELLIWYPLLEDERHQLCVGVP